MSEIDGSNILITGGTGSFGQAFIRHILDHHNPARVVVFSRDELKQHEMRGSFSGEERVRWFLGDIRDRERLDRAMHGIDIVIHAAALKQVDTAEYNPFEFVKTNVLGSQNVIDAAIDAEVRKVVALSTDKASSPINLYGATKLTADKLFIAGNNYAHHGSTRLAVVRYGNVMGSRGSVIPLFRRLISAGDSLPVTDPRMTRFWITLDQAVRFVTESLEIMTGGELYVPKIPSMRITDLIEAIAPGYPTRILGIRPGEKLHEEMISVEDSSHTIELPNRYVILPLIAGWGFHAPAGAEVEDGFSYRSDTNTMWLTAEQLRASLA